jgi:hypothetical protein
VRVATVQGRFYAMDRDNRWERVEAAYRALVRGEGLPARTGTEAIEAAYARDENDEFQRPAVVVDDVDKPIGRIRDRDSVIFFNFRADRAREITRAITADEFEPFDRGATPYLSGYVCFGTYDRTFGLPVAFPNESPRRIFGELIAEARLRQLRIAETEKYAHVTFFFNGGREQVFEREERILVPSPKIATYDLQPEMSAPEVTERLVARLRERAVDFFLLNFANADMVGHSGIYEAAVRACKTVDTCVGAVAKETLAQGRRPDRHRRPRKLGEDVGLRDELPPYGPHDEPGPADPRGRAVQGASAARGGRPRGHRADAPRDPRDGEAARDEREEPAEVGGVGNPERGCLAASGSGGRRNGKACSRASLPHPLPRSDLSAQRRSVRNREAQDLMARSSSSSAAAEGAPTPAFVREAGPSGPGRGGRNGPSEGAGLAPRTFAVQHVRFAVHSRR